METQSHSDPLAKDYKITLFVWLSFVTFYAVYALFWATDYVGSDNDDVMRLVQIRDFMAGQGWFDLTQYRLGLDDGTLLHWSRLVDVPIAGLISFFSIFIELEMAEAIALFIWPSLLILPTIFGISRAGHILAPRYGAPVGAMMGAAFVYGISKFTPGAIDHHNVQIALLANIVPILIATTPSWIGYGVAGILSALAIAIGAETTPFIAIICMIVALSWGYYGGKIYRRPTRVFALSFGISLTGVFFLTIPASAHLVVVCDALSFGYYGLGITGATGLFLASALLSYHSKLVRFMGLSAIALVVFLWAIWIAPECMQSPLAGLNPLVNELWLKNVQEAKSFWALANQEPSLIPDFYIVPVIAIIICLRAIFVGFYKDAHIKLLALLLMAFVISLVQVRGAIFSNLIAIIPLTAWTSHLRVRYIEHPRDLRVAVSFLLAVAVSLPIFWMSVAAFFQNQYDDSKQQTQMNKAADHRSPTAVCMTEDVLTTLVNLPKGLVLAPSNLGATILRYSDHRVLSAPYHRNQSGLLAEINIAMALPDEARQLSNQYGVDYLIFCADDPQIRFMAMNSPNGLYARINDGHAPAYLKPITENSTGITRIYRVE